MLNPVYTYISNIYDLVWFGLVWFYGISTIVGYLMPNPLYTYTGARQYFSDTLKKVLQGGH